MTDSSKKRVLVPLAPGFEEIEAVTIIDVLRRADIEVVVAALSDLRVPGAHGIDVQADATLADVRASGRKFDAVVLPGGMPGAGHLRDDKRVHAALTDVLEQGGIAAAVCAAPIALEAAGVIAGRRVTSYPSVREQLVSAAAWTGERVVEDGPIVTGAGPGAALEFSLALVARLTSPETARELATKMLVQA